MGYVRNIFWLILISVMIVEGQETTQILHFPQKNADQTFFSTQIIDRDIRPGDRVDRQTDYNLQRDTADTLVHASYGWNSQFIQEPGDAMLVVYQMPTDGFIMGVNVPVQEWGTGDQQLTISLHRLSYPYRANGLVYSSAIVDGNGWIGGYDMDDSTGYMYIMGTHYSQGGTAGICDPNDTVAAGAQDPLGFEPVMFGPTGVPLMGLIWPIESTSATLDTINHPDIASGGGDNWLNTADYGTEPVFLSGDYIGILVQSTGAGGGDAPETGFQYQAGEPLGLNNPWTSLKFYGSTVPGNECGGTSGNGGWHIRSWIFRFELAVWLTGPTRPRIIDLTYLPTSISTEPRNVDVHIIDGSYPCIPEGIDTASVFFRLDSVNAAVNEIPLSLITGTTMDGTWSGTIPGQEPGTTVYWWVEATNMIGMQATSPTQFYYIFRPVHHNLFFYNSTRFPAWIQDYYLAETGLQADFWNYGVGSIELFDNYDFVIEMTGGGPNWINSDSIRSWIEAGGNYILAGDEWLGAQTGWVDLTYSPGSFQYDILGIAADHNDISGGHGVSRLLTVANDSISGAMHTYLADSLELNYDPVYELGFTNWLDGVTPVTGVNVAFYGLSGQIDSLNNPPVDADTFATGIYHTLSGGGKVVFLTFDPLATNTTAPNTVPNYHWIGVESYGPLQAAIGWVLGTTATDESDTFMPQQLTLHQNYPNPFNPVTTIRYELPERTDIRMTIYDLLGREVAVLEDGVQGPGIGEVRWNAANVASGIYFYQIRAGEFVQTRKMVVLK